MDCRYQIWSNTLRRHYRPGSTPLVFPLFIWCSVSIRARTLFSRALCAGLSLVLSPSNSSLAVSLIWHGKWLGENRLVVSCFLLLLRACCKASGHIVGAGVLVLGSSVARAIFPPFCLPIVPFISVGLPHRAHLAHAIVNGSRPRQPSSHSSDALPLSMVGSVHVLPSLVFAWARHLGCLNADYPRFPPTPRTGIMGQCVLHTERTVGVTIGVVS